MKIAPTVGVLLHSRRARGAVLTFLWPAVRGLVLALVVGLVVYGLDWAGYDRTVQTISTTCLTAFVVYQLYEYAMGNLAEARKHNDELR